jgi:hypothetical protein
MIEALHEFNLLFISPALGKAWRGRRIILNECPGNGMDAADWIDLAEDKDKLRAAPQNTNISVVDEGL